MERLNVSYKTLAGSIVMGLVSLCVVCSVSCTREPVGGRGQEPQTLTEAEKESWDATAVFLAGVFTIANAEGLDSTIFFENFRANYDWIKNVFLPHIRGTPEHPWWKCDEYCVETAKRLANGDEEREKELMEILSRYELQERERSPSSRQPSR